jgi:hypothetical protein
MWCTARLPKARHLLACDLQPDLNCVYGVVTPREGVTARNSCALLLQLDHLVKWLQAFAKTIMILGYSGIFVG